MHTTFWQQEMQQFVSWLMGKRQGSRCQHKNIQSRMPRAEIIYRILENLQSAPCLTTYSCSWPVHTELIRAGYLHTCYACCVLLACACMYMSCMHALVQMHARVLTSNASAIPSSSHMCAAMPSTCTRRPARGRYRPWPPPAVHSAVLQYKEMRATQT